MKLNKKIKEGNIEKPIWGKGKLNKWKWIKKIKTKSKKEINEKSNQIN